MKRDPESNPTSFLGSYPDKSYKPEIPNPYINSIPLID